jgi:pSer/pThr/pTyr-binding forkhead associated (FHA) protein
MDEYIEVKIDVFEHTGQRARLRKTLTISGLVEEILKEFDDISADAPGKYALFLKGTDRPLNPANSLEQLDLQPQDELVFNYLRQANRQMLDSRNYAFLRDDAAGRVYDIQWQPAIIGRPTNDADHNINLAVNLQLHAKGQSVSRKHAQVTFSGGRFIIEPLAAQNPVFVNGKEIPFGSRKEIRTADRIQLGHKNLVLTFSTQTQTPTAAGESRAPAATPQPASQPAPVFPPQSAPVNYSKPAVLDGATNLSPESAVLVRLIVEVAKNNANLGKRLEIITFPFALGRDLPQLSGENEVSRRHAEIQFNAAQKKFYITDLKSTNGVTLQGNRIEAERPYELTPGMRIGLGPVVLLRFEI